MERCFKKFRQDVGEIFSLYTLKRLSKKSKTIGWSQRAFFRRIAKRKAHLVGMGYCSELVRLQCYALANPHIDAREVRVWKYFQRWHHERDMLGEPCPCCRK